MKRPSVLTVLAVGATLSLSACGGSTEGQTPPETESATSTTTTGTTSSKSSSQGPLAGVDPCELVSQQQLQQLGTPKLVDQGENGSARTCTYQSPTSASPLLSVRLAIREEQGLKSFQGDYQETTIADQAVKLQCGTGNCLIGIDVTESSRVDVQGTVVGDDAAAKELSKQVAEMVISNLPQG